MLFVALALVAAWAAAGFLLAPSLLRHPIERKAAAMLGREVAIARLRLNPFTLSTTVEGLAITERGGAPLLRWDRLFVDFQAWASLFKRSWVFREIDLEGASARLVLEPGGALNIDDILARLTPSEAPPGAAPAGPPPAVLIHRLRVEDTLMNFIDRSGAETFTTTLGPLRIDLRDFTTRTDARNAYSFQGRSELGETFSWSGQFALAPIRSEGEFAIQNLTLGKYHPYYRGVVPFDIRGGAADVHSKYRLAWGTTDREVRLIGAACALRDLKVSEHGKEEIALDAPAAELKDGDIELLTGVAMVGAITARGGHVLMRKTADGHVNLLDMLLPFFAAPAAVSAAPSKPATPRPAPAPTTGPAPTIRVGTISFFDYTLDAEDQSPPHPAKVRLDQINLTLLGVDNVPATTEKGKLDLRWNGEGTLHAEGDLSLVGLVGDLKVKLDGLDVVPVGAYVEPALDMRVTAGTFSADGRVHADLTDAAKPEFAFQGDARLMGFTAVDGTKHADFLRWRGVQMTGVDYSLRRDRMRIQDLAIDGADATLTRFEDGSLNVATVLRLPATPEPAGDDTEAPAAGPAPADAPAEAPAATSPPAPPKPAAADEGDTRVAHIRLRDSRIRVIDRAMQPAATFALTHIEGTLAGISSRPGARADVKIGARVDDTAPVSIEGQVDPLGSDLFSDLTLKGQGIDLGPLGPYSARYLGYALDRARLDLDMHYHLENRSLEGANLLTANPFLLGAKTDSPDATHLPVRLGLALLRDRHGVIKLDVPVQGSLDDPHFRLGRVILHALVNVFAKLVTSPFTLLARAFAGHDVDLSVIDFRPGTAAIDAEAKSRLDALVKALTDRPGLTLSIAGSSDASIDTDDLKRARLESLVREAKWRSLGRHDRESTPADGVVVAPEERAKYVKAAWKTFREGRPAEEGQPKPQTSDDMEAWMLARITIGPADLTALAASRADAVRGYLTAAGVEAARLFVKSAVAAPATPGAATAGAARVALDLQ
jgi:hypothetical protein